MKKQIVSLLKIIVAGAVPVVLFAIVFMKAGITQGNNTILTSDLNGQYVNLMVYFRNALINGDNIFYSFSGLLGIDTIGLLGYYLLSPFNLLILLFPANEITDAIYLIIALKVMCAGIFSFIYFGRNNDYDYKMLILSTSYALSGYVFAYFMNIMWLDGVYMLPLVAFGIEKLFENKKIITYTVTLALSFIFCYYTGYMIAGFSLLYYSYLVFLEKREVKDIIRRYVLFFGTSVLAACISCFVLLPVMFSQMGSRGVVEAEYGINSITGFLSRFFTGVFNGEQFAQGAPHVYCGIIVLFFAVLYFMPQKEKRDRRRLIVSAILLSAFILSFLIDILDVVWHIFSFPNSFTHRYAFIFIFVMLIFVKDIIDKYIDKIRVAGIVIADLILIALYVIVLYKDFDSVQEIYLNIDMICLIIVSVIFVIAITKCKKILQPLFIGVFVLQCCLLVVNGRKYVSIFQFDDHSLKGYYNAMKIVTDKVKEIDDGLYRMEKSFYNSNNDAMLLSYNGLSHFSSADKNYIKEFMGNLGYTKNYDFWAFYDKGASFAGDSLLGMKYYLGSIDEGVYEKIDEVNDINIYENPYALSMGTIVSENIKNVGIKEMSPFENQKNIFDAIYGEETKLFTFVDDYKMDVSNLVWNTGEDNVNSFNKEDVEKSALITLKYVSPDNNPAYLFFDSGYTPGLNVSVNGMERGEYLTTYHQGVLPLGVFEQGTDVTIELKLQGNHAAFDNPLIATLDMERLETVTTELRNKGWNVHEFDNNYIKADVDVESDSVLFTTIPYNKNWKVKIDGVDAKTYMVCDALLAVDIEEGKHTVTLEYVVSEMYAGIIISIIGLVILIILLIRSYTDVKKIA